jgi:hypothetical protein
VYFLYIFCVFLYIFCLFFVYFCVFFVYFLYFCVFLCIFCVFFPKFCRENSSSKLDKIMGTFMKTYVHLITSRSDLLTMRHISDKSCRENPTTHFTFSNYFFFENRAVCEIMWKNLVERGRPQMAIWRMRIAYWITKATNTHSEYTILIAFPLQQWLRERTSMLRYTYFVQFEVMLTK